MFGSYRLRPGSSCSGSKGECMGMWDALKRRAFKGAVVEAVNGKYGINLRAETAYLSSPNLDDMLDALYDNVPPGCGGEAAKIAGVMLLETMLAEREVNLEARGQLAKLPRMIGRG
jgi:hypothetical protein